MRDKYSFSLVVAFFLWINIWAENTFAYANNPTGKWETQGEGFVAAPPSDYRTLASSAATEQAAEVKATDVFRDYLKVIGGITVLEHVRSLHILSIAQVEGMDFNFELKAMAPRLEVMTMSTQGHVVMRSLFNGTSGFTQMGDNIIPLTEAEIKERTMLTFLVEQIDYLKNPAFVAEVKGIERVNGADAYKINILYPSGKTKSEFYDIKSKLLVKKEETKTEGFKTTTTSMVFTNYKMVGKINFPFTQTITISSSSGEKQVLEMKATEVKMNEGVSTADFK